jgi:ABC-type branched-subunit amino acid transport system substrate-binding protein
VLVNLGTADMTPQVSDLKASGAELLLCITTPDTDQTAVLKAKIQLGWNVPVIGVRSMTNPGTTSNFTKAELANVFAMGDYKTMTYRSEKAGKGAPSWPQARKFIAGYAKFLKAHSFKIPVGQAASGYDGAMVILNGIKGAKTTDPDKVKSYIETHPYVGVRGKYVFSADTHHGVTPEIVTIVYAGSRNNYGIYRSVK